MPTDSRKEQRPDPAHSASSTLQARIEATRSMPGRADAWLDLSMAELDVGVMQEAAAAARRAAGCVVTHPAQVAAVCGQLVRTGEYLLAHQLLRHRDHAGSPIPVLVELATIAHQLGDADHALLLLDRLDRQAAGPHAAYLHATMLLFCGHVERAETALEDCIGRSPLFAPAQWTLSKLQRWNAAHNHVGRLRSTIARLSPNDHQQPYLHFALFKELDDLDDTEGAWDALMRGCAARRAQVEYDAVGEAELLGRLAATCGPAFFARAEHRDVGGPRPVFVCGLPRSGSTLLERLLGGHPSIATAGELHDFPMHVLWAANHASAAIPDASVVARAASLHHAKIGDRYLLNASWRARGKPFFTDKLPRNSLYAGLIHRALPGARLLHVVRSPMDTCFSCLKELFGAAYPYSYTMQEVAAHYRNHAALMVHWHEVLGDALVDVRYEDVATDPETSMRCVIEGLGLEWSPQCLEPWHGDAAVSTASTVQVRDAVHARGIGQWRRYEARLRPMADALGLG